MKKEMKKEYDLDIEGYWREIKKASIPAHSGVYFVYVCTHENKKVTLHRLIYIGEAGNVRSRIADHEKKANWVKYLKEGNELCYSTCLVPSIDRERVEAAYIFKHEPPVNTEYKNSFPFDETRVKSKGKTRLINTDFTVYRTS